MKNLTPQQIQAKKDRIQATKDRLNGDDYRIDLNNLYTNIGN
jgi:hypothetical protein